MIFKDTIEVVEGVSKADEHGNTTVDWSVPIVVARLRCHVDTRTTTLNSTDTGIHVGTRYVALVRQSVNLNTRTQRLRWRGRVYLLDGNELVHTAQGRVHHVELPLTRTGT